MEFNSLPVREEGSIIAEFLIWNSGDSENKLNLFVEDFKGSLTYRELIDRKYDNKFEYNLYPCKSRKKVVENFHIWNERYKKISNTIFLVDKDFSLWTEDKLLEDDNLLVWDYFTLENYLVNFEAAAYVLNVFLPDKNELEAKQIFEDFEKWLINQFVILKPLFISFVISHKHNLSSNTSITPHVFYNNKEGELDFRIINNKIEEIKESCHRMSVEYGLEYQMIESYYNNRPNNGLHELIKGKYLLTYLIYEINKRVRNYKRTRPTNENILYQYFVMKTPLENFSQLWSKIDDLAID